MPITDKSLYQIALTYIKGVGVILVRNLMSAVGDEEAIFRESGKKLEMIDGISARLVSEIRNPDVLRLAEKELNFASKNSIDLLFYTQACYPQRLTNCVDAPILLYSKGRLDYNKTKFVSVVGTRNATSYGRNFCDRFIRELSELFPDIVIVSGLAHGIDVCAHKCALKNGLQTIAVLGHGLDRIYPAANRKIAQEMLEKGSLLTEYPSNTNADKFNFVKRNRIVAGMADALIVVESGLKGGSLITAGIANSYYRDVFALPGRIDDAYSSGCNMLIGSNMAALLSDVGSFVKVMGWSDRDINKRPVQRQLFLELNEVEQKVFDALQKNDTLQVNMLAIDVEIPLSELFFILLEMEIKGVVRALPGGVYKLI